jgi:hypothetical protein
MLGRQVQSPARKFKIESAFKVKARIKQKILTSLYWRQTL